MVGNQSACAEATMARASRHCAAAFCTVRFDTSTRDSNAASCASPKRVHHGPRAAASAGVARVQADAAASPPAASVATAAATAVAAAGDEVDSAPSLYAAGTSTCGRT
jgi:hypothetical protein